MIFLNFFFKQGGNTTNQSQKEEVDQYEQATHSHISVLTTGNKFLHRFYSDEEGEKRLANRFDTTYIIIYDPKNGFV